MRSVATGVARSVVCVSAVCVSACELCKNGWTDRDAVWALTRMGPRNHILNRDRNHPQEAAMLGGCLVHWKALGVSAVVCAAKDIIQSSIAAWQRDCGNRLQCSWLISVTLHFPPWKIRSLAMRPFVRILWPLVSTGWRTWTGVDVVGWAAASVTLRY